MADLCLWREEPDEETSKQRERLCEVRDERLSSRCRHTTYAEEHECSEADVLQHCWRDLTDNEVVHLRRT